MFASLVATSRDFGLAWDEALTIGRERDLATWFGQVFDPPFSGARARAFREASLDRYWRFSRAEPDGHPPFYALLGLVGWKLTHRWCSPLLAYRLGPMALMAATAGFLCWHLTRRHGHVAGVLGSLLVVFLPRNFAHAHYAHYDEPMTCFWLLSQAAFAASLDRRRWIVPFGLCLGLGLGTKFTGIFALAAPVAWAMLFELPPALVGPPGHRREKPATRAILWGIPIAILTLYAIQPAWWIAPWTARSGSWRRTSRDVALCRSQPFISAGFTRTRSRFITPWCSPRS